MEKCTRRTSVCLECPLVSISLWLKLNIMMKDIQQPCCVSSPFKIWQPLSWMMQDTGIGSRKCQAGEIWATPLGSAIRASKIHSEPLQAQCSFLVLSFRGGPNFWLCKWQTLQLPARDARGKKKDDIDFRDYRTVSETLAKYFSLLYMLIFTRSHLSLLGHVCTSHPHCFARQVSWQSL